MSRETVNGRVNYYGPRALNEARQSEKHAGGAVRELVFSFRGEDFSGTDYVGGTHSLPAGSVVLDAIAEVTEAFVLGGTTPTISIGTDGSAATNGVELSEAQAEAAGTYSLTAGGTWANPLAAATTVDVELGGTSPTVTSAGACKFVIRYAKI